MRRQKQFPQFFRDQTKNAETPAPRAHHTQGPARPPRSPRLRRAKSLLDDDLYLSRGTSHARPAPSAASAYTAPRCSLAPPSFPAPRSPAPGRMSSTQLSLLTYHRSRGIRAPPPPRGGIGARL